MSATWVVVATTVGCSPPADRQPVTLTAAMRSRATNRPALAPPCGGNPGRLKRFDIRSARGEAGAAHLAVAPPGRQAAEERPGLLAGAPGQGRWARARD